MKKLLLYGICLLISVGLSAQQYNPAGTAFQSGSPGCYQITGALSQAGAVWNVNMINLTQPFDITLTLNFGNRPDIYWDNGVLCGGDGMSFVLQPVSSGVFGLGSGVGFSGINPSLGVVMDTYHFNPSDPPGQHISMHKNGDELHGTTNELVPTTAAVGFPANITDGLNHLFRFTWTPIGGGVGIINVYFGNATTLPTIPTLTYNGNIVANIFSGNPNVYWGVSGSTGGCWNLQTVCMTTVANFSSATSACVGVPVAFTSNSISGLPINGYYWDFGDGGMSNLQNPSHTYTTAGTYNVNLTITNTGGFTSTMTHSIVIYPLPDIIFTTTPNPICQGGSSVITASGASTYVWSGGLGTAASINVAPTTTTIYTITGTSTNGCTNTDTITLTVNPNPVITPQASPDTICLGNSSLLTANSSVAGTTYVWMPGSVANDSATVSPTTATTYTVTGTAAGCTGTATVAVNIYPPLNITVSPPVSTICNGGSTTLTASGASTYAWSPPDSLTSTTGSTVTASPSVTTVYTVNASNAAGCTGSTTATVNVTTGPFISITALPDHICAGDSSLLSVALAAQSYTWTPAGSLGNPTGQSTTAHPLITTTYTIVADNNGCLSTDEFTLVVHPIPVADFASNVQDACHELNVTFQDLTAPAGASWSWTFGDEASADNTSTQQHPNHLYADTGSYDVSLIVVTAGGCTDTVSKTDYITVFPRPRARFEAKPQRTNILESRVFFTDLSDFATAWDWNFGDKLPMDNNSHLQHPSHLYSDTGTFYPKLYVSNAFGCVDSAAITVIIDPNISYYLPNAFTPESDKNPVFRLYGEGVDLNTYSMRIFDRWGKELYFSADMEEGWNGKVNGKTLAEQGIYTYMVSFNDVVNHYHLLKGAVMLLK